LLPTFEAFELFPIAPVELDLTGIVAELEFDDGNEDFEFEFELE